MQNLSVMVLTIGILSLSNKLIVFTITLNSRKNGHIEVPNNVTLIRKLNEESIELVRGFRNFKRNLLIMIINCKVMGFNFPLLIDHTAREAEYFMRTLKKFNKGILDPFKMRLLMRIYFG